MSPNIRIFPTNSPDSQKTKSMRSYLDLR